MQPKIAEKIRNAVTAAIDTTRSDLSNCDASDIEELAQRIEQELKALHPNTQTLGTYLNSIARSLRNDPAARAACMQLDAVMREAGVVPSWESI